MIKFFRKIRRNLLSKGKTREYLKYGFGEIILVVIGILIAVQINNWNIDRQNEEKEILYLTRLTTNLGSDKRLYEYIIKEDSLLIAELKAIQNDIANHIQTINQPVEDFKFLTKGYKFGSNRTVIDNLISSGQIELLRSNYLVENILVYYRQTEHNEATIDATIKAQNSRTINDLILKFNSNNKKDSSYIEILKNYIHFRIYLIEQQLESYTSQKIRAEKLIDKINKEIYYIETVY
ncbi:MAG: DUF6090 family protein [Bacteroidota bacterium]